MYMPVFSTFLKINLGGLSLVGRGCSSVTETLVVVHHACLLPRELEF